MPTQTFNASDSWEAPAGVTSVQAECWGPGGGGGARTDSIPDDPGTKEDESQPAVNGGGGGGGAYAKKNVIAVTPGNFYTVTIAAGVDTWFVTSTTVLAKRGQNGSIGAAGLGGTTIDSIGDVKTPGSNGTISAGGAAGNGGAGGAANTNGTAPGGGGGGDATQAGTGPGAGAAGRVTLTWEDPAPPPPDPTIARSQVIIIGY